MTVHSNVPRLQNFANAFRKELTSCFVVFSTAKRSQPLAGGRLRRTTGKRSTTHVAFRRNARGRGAGIPPGCETFRDIEPVVRLRRSGCLCTTFANSRGPQHETCAREIGSFDLPVFQERENVRGNLKRVARDCDQRLNKLSRRVSSNNASGCQNDPAMHAGPDSNQNYPLTSLKNHIIFPSSDRPRSLQRLPCGLRGGP